MFAGGVGLTEVSSGDLRKALRALHRGDLDLPVTVASLARVGLQHCSQPLLSHLRDLQEPGARAVLVAVLAERAREERID